MQNFKPLFPVILQILDLHCQVQVSLKLFLSSFATSSWNFENWKTSTNWKTEKRIVFSLHKSFRILWGKNYFQNVTLSFFVYVIELEFAKLLNWIQMNMIFKISRPTKFYKKFFLKKFSEFTWKQLRSKTLKNRDSSADVFL